MSNYLKNKNSILLKLALAISLCFISAFVVSNYLVTAAVTPLLSTATDESTIKSSYEVIGQIHQELNIAKTLAISIANIASTIPREREVLQTLLPKIITAQGIQKNITGGGIWPEPFKFDKKQEKSSLFWGRNKQGIFVPFDDYNKPSSPAYHNEDWYRPVKELPRNQVNWSKSYIAPYTKQHMVTVSAPIWLNSDYYGVSTIDLNLDNIITSIESNAQKLGGHGFLVDSDGRFISSPNTQFEHYELDNNSISLQILKQNTGTFILQKNVPDDRGTNNLALANNKSIRFFNINTENPEGNSRVLLVHMPDIQWTIGFITPKTVFTNPINSFLKEAAAYQILTLILFLGLIFFALEQLVRKPFLSLFNQLKNEDKLLIYPKTGDELAMLAELFNKRHTQIQESQKQLYESTDILQRALDSAHAGTLFFDVASHRLQWDEKSSCIFDLSPQQQEVSNKFELLEKLIHPDDLEKVTTKFKEALDDDSILNYQADYRIRLTDSSIRWIQGSLRILRNEDGTAISCSGLHFDLTEKKLSEASIQDKEVAEESNRLKSEFLANMSHELRTPMHGILSFANFGIKKSETASREKLLQYFVYIQTSGQRLLVLLNDLLDLSKVEAGKLILNKQKSDLNTIIQTCCNEQQQRLADSSVTLELNKSSGTCTGNFDPTRIGQVICNLLSNAIKFGLPNGTINITTNLNDLGQLTFSINNDGQPIPTAEIETIFDPFIQSSKPPSDITGTGLGLAISREFIEAHGGKIWAEANIQTGATFKFILPAK